MSDYLSVKALRHNFDEAFLHLLKDTLSRGKALERKQIELRIRLLVTIMDLAELILFKMGDNSEKENFVCPLSTYGLPYYFKRFDLTVTEQRNVYEALDQMNDYIGEDVRRYLHRGHNPASC